MRSIRFAVIIAVAALVFLFNPAGTSDATPGAGGLPVFSVSTIIPPAFPGAPGWDITAAAEPVFGLPCTSADVLTGVAFGPPCAARAGPAPLGPVPWTMSLAPADLGLNLVAGAFTDDLDGLSYREAAVAVADYDFSVDAAPGVPPVGNGGSTVGIPGCGPAPNVGTEAAALEAQGDIFTTAAPAPPGCNVQAPGCPGIVLCDEAALGLVPLPPASPFPPAPPLDNIDALAEFTGAPGPCLVAGGIGGTTVCPAFTVTAGSAVLGAIAFSLPPCSGLPADGATILVPPGAPPTTCTPAGCLPGGPPCIAVDSLSLGLVPFGDDIDALCWFDININMVPDPPMSLVGPGGDMYMFSLTPGSASVPPYSAADILGTKGLVFAPTVIRTPASLGLLPSDNVDGLICHQVSVDGDNIPDDLDNCPAAGNGAQADGDLDGVGDVCDNCPTDANPNQANFEGDAMGDVCDPDDENDGNPDVTDPDDDNDNYSDAVEAACGSVTPNLSTPERLGNGIDDDVDSTVDELQALSGTTTANDFDCDGDGFDDRDEALYVYPASFGAGPEAGAACLNNSDDDLDGKRNDGCEPTGIDVRSGTDWQQRCANNPAPPPNSFDEADDQWSADFNDDGVVNILDVSSFSVPAPAVWSGGLPTLPGAPNYNARWDLASPGGAINILDISAINRPIPSLGGITAGSVGLVLPCAVD